MREAAEKKVWKKLLKAYPVSAQTKPSFEFEDVSLDTNRPCIVLGGLNGAGKSRVMRAMAENQDQGGPHVLINLHFLCEQALMVLMARRDVDDMKAESGPINPGPDRLDDVERIIGRRYDSVEWYALDIEPANSLAVEQFKWLGDAPLVPYFVVSHNGVEYSALQMGLGEFSMHFLFWILEQLKGSDNLVLLLDEPDAYLPSVGVRKLLHRLLQICLTRNWSMILSTHSEEMIREAVDHQSFVLLMNGSGGRVTAQDVRSYRGVADVLLTEPSVRYIFFVEDESAKAFLEAILEAYDATVLKEAEIVWKDGHGYLSKLTSTLPRPPRSRIKFAFVYDGDQRGMRQNRPGGWPVHFLPGGDPDEMFMAVGSDRSAMAARLPADQAAFDRLAASLDGIDPHDWVNRVGGRFGRAATLRALGTLWVERNDVAASSFAAGLLASLKEA